MLRNWYRVYKEDKRNFLMKIEYIKRMKEIINENRVHKKDDSNLFMNRKLKL